MKWQEDRKGMILGCMNMQTNIADGVKTITTERFTPKPPLETDGWKEAIIVKLPFGNREENHGERIEACTNGF